MNKKEIVDQSLHFLYGLTATAILGWFLPILVALLVVALGALFREHRQHPDRSFLRLFNLDMAFVLLGQALCILLLATL